MRLYMYASIVLVAGATADAADLGWPVPMRPAGVAGKVAPAPACPCGNACDCAAGQCPVCPTHAATVKESPTATAPIVTYRQVWLRGRGWVWVQDGPATAVGGCSGGVCRW